MTENGTMQLEIHFDVEQDIVIVDRTDIVIFSTIKRLFCGRKTAMDRLHYVMRNNRHHQT